MQTTPSGGAAMNSSSPISNETLLDMMFSDLMKRLSGTDPEYDSEIIDLFSEALQIPKRAIVNKMRAHCHPAPPTLN